MPISKKKKVKKSSSAATEIINKILIASIIVCAAIFVGYKLFFGPDTFEVDKFRYPIFGIDVSRHNGKINWENIKSSNIDFVFIKASEGRTLLDPWFKANLAGVKKENIRFGIYHFFKFNRDGNDQARLYLAQIKATKSDFPPILDIEEYTNTRSGKSIKDIVKEIKKFISTVESSTGRKVIIYMNEHDYNKYIKDNFNDNPLWVCSLDEEPNIDRDWKFWQYTHRGKLKSQRGLFDFNTFNGGKAEWSRYFNSLSK